MCSVMLPNFGPRDSTQPRRHALLYMVSRGSTLEWHVPCAPCCLKIYIVTNFFLRLAHVLQFYSTTLVCSLVSYLRPIGRISPFILRNFTIKSLYIEKQIRQLLPLRIRHRNSSALQITSTQLGDIIALRPSPFVAPRFSLLLSFARRLLRRTAPRRALSHFAPQRIISNSL